MMDTNDTHKYPADITKAMQVVSAPSALPTLPAAYDGARYPYGPANQAPEGVRLRDIWTAISKRRWLIISIVVLITATTSVMLARKPDIFLAETSVQVDTESPASGLTGGKGNPIILDYGSDPSYFNTQLQILTKPGLLRRVVKTLDLEHNPEFLRAQAQDTTWSRLLRTFGLGGKMPTESIAKNDNGKLLIGKDVASATSPNDLSEAIRLEPFVTAIQSGLRVEPVKEERLQYTETRLISIKFTHASPIVAAKVANAIADTFVLSNLEQKTKSTSTTGDFLQRRIAELQTEIHADEEKLLNYAKNHEILSLDATQNTVVDRLSGLNKQLLEAENERKMAEAAYRVSKETGSADIAASTNPVTQGLEAQLTQLKQKRAQLLVDNTEEWPEVKEVEKQIAVLEKEIQEKHSKAAANESTSLEAKYREALQREQALRTAFEQQRGETRTQNEAAINYKIIQQEIETNKSLLDGLLQRAKENDVILADTPNNLHVTDYAIPPRGPIGPNRLQGVMLAFLFSLGFGVCLATLLEYLDDGVRSTEDVSRLLRLPTLATIPALKNGLRRKRLAAANGKLLQLKSITGDGNGNGSGANPALLLDIDKRSPLAEAFRHLRTSVLLSSAGRAPKVLVVTSCVPAEGKTTTTLNLAVSLAQTGARVLVIDADMRRPRIHTAFGIDNVRGLCNILANETSESETLALLQHEKQSGLYLLPAGPVPPNPAELIGSEQMRKLVAEMSATFDHVVIDSPPIASFTDGVLLAASSDGVLLVINASESSRKVILRSQQALHDVGAKILGVVLNKVDSRSPDFYYGYRYYNYYDPEKSRYGAGSEEAHIA